MHSVESRFVIGPSNILSAGAYACTFQPGSDVSQAVAVKGLISSCLQRGIGGDQDPRRWGKMGTVPNAMLLPSE